MKLDYPPTIIIREPNEHTHKCSIYPIKGKRDDVIFHTWPVNLKSEWTEQYIRLAPDGPELSKADCDKGILLLDASWRRAKPMVRAYEEIEPRSLNGYVTAFPRVSKLGTDPDNGLASIEALFIAYQILGRPTDQLLDHYRWQTEFLRLNHFLSDSTLNIESEIHNESNR